ncbi:DUF6191 domain-containing protein [Streptomyces sp. NPDC053493]|uniref:DUF6191 domain-containing protein n=1 Tax=Streptomyces sp. NPDC053493 TaxID=3365705 RepID=UPI0037D1606E
MFNPIEELFAPGRKHTEDERQRLALTREDVGEGDPYKGPIDLASGKVTIRIPTEVPEEPPADADASETADSSAADSSGSSGAAGSTDA